MGEGRELVASGGTNLSKHSSLSVPEPKMLRTATPGGGLSCWAPRLPTSSGIFHLCLTFWLGQVGLLQGHSQCLDHGPPFQPSPPLEFCSHYEAFGRCDQHKDYLLATRYSVVMDFFDLRGHKLCGSYIKDILCQVGLGVTLQGSEGASLAKCGGAGLGGCGSWGGGGGVSLGIQPFRGSRAAASP